VRIDGRFELVRARSVPRQEPPYRPLTEVVADQRVFELTAIDGTMLGFRFPDYAEGIEVSGWHLHFISSDHSRGGHVLASRSSALHVQLDPSGELRVELPPGVDLTNAEHAGSTHDAIDRVERQGRAPGVRGSQSGGLAVICLRSGSIVCKGRCYTGRRTVVGGVDSDEVRCVRGGSRDARRRGARCFGPRLQ
jgi:hypothetical protein